MFAENCAQNKETQMRNKRFKVVGRNVVAVFVVDQQRQKLVFDEYSAFMESVVVKKRDACYGNRRSQNYSDRIVDFQLVQYVPKCR